MVLSPFILEELRRNLVQKFDVSPDAVKKLIYRIAQVADVYHPTGTVHVVPKRHADNLILETAILGKARYLVTGDQRDLLPLKVHRNVKIIAPWVFLNHIKK